MLSSVRQHEFIEQDAQSPSEPRIDRQHHSPSNHHRPGRSGQGGRGRDGHPATIASRPRSRASDGSRSLAPLNEMCHGEATTKAPPARAIPAATLAPFATSKSPGAHSLATSQPRLTSSGNQRGFGPPAGGGAAKPDAASTGVAALTIRLSLGRRLPAGRAGPARRNASAARPPVTRLRRANATKARSALTQAAIPSGTVSRRALNWPADEAPCPP